MSIFKKALTGLAIASILFTSNVLTVSAGELNDNSNAKKTTVDSKIPAGHGPYQPGPAPINFPQHPPVPGQINNDAHNDPAYDMGYREGYNSGYRESYPEGYQQGLRDGEESGYRNGVNDGIRKFNEKYVD
ncbi:MAG TPA: hypothetical protein PKK26_15150, partial [Candidatus Wallbacteria bacterium]|nr:hypothetical protein [Candidatus Wallbacteria bacterium]